jgi:diguanylate cyclase (GGDEF)-like protein
MAMIRDIRLAAPKDRYPIQLDDLRPLVDSLLKSGGELLADQSIMEEIRKSDQLTGLATRRAFDLRLSQLFEQNKMGYASTVFLIDISQMGLLNNKYGQETGDGIIRDFATAISTILRESDFIARIGGDKFGVILPFTDLATSKKLADRLRMQLTTEIGKLGPNKIMPNWRGGMASMQPTDQSPKSVFQRAENVLLSAKHGGDNVTLS